MIMAYSTFGLFERDYLEICIRNTWSTPMLQSKMVNHWLETPVSMIKNDFLNIQILSRASEVL